MDSVSEIHKLRNKGISEFLKAFQHVPKAHI